MHRCECCSEIEELQRRLRAQEKTLYRQLNIIDRLAKSVPMQVSTCSDSGSDVEYKLASDEESQVLIGIPKVHGNKRRCSSDAVGFE